mmetsp:Transcript_33226/g.87011  ORF Transcript_33226/g.87011 Transcript_33226/m.87011 type:complete len:95 (-) Transcript_33226:3912-4196(-)
MLVFLTTAEKTGSFPDLNPADLVTEERQCHPYPWQNFRQHFLVLQQDDGWTAHAPHRACDLWSVSSLSTLFGIESCEPGFFLLAKLWFFRARRN